MSCRALLVVVGIGWLLVLPFDELGRSTYMDENAVQPAQVRTEPYSRKKVTYVRVIVT